MKTNKQKKQLDITAVTMHSKAISNEGTVDNVMGIDTKSEYR